MSEELRVDILTNEAGVSMIKEEIHRTENRSLKMYLPPSHADDIGVVSCSACVGLIFVMVSWDAFAGHSSAEAQKNRRTISLPISTLFRNQGSMPYDIVYRIRLVTS